MHHLQKTPLVMVILLMLVMSACDSTSSGEGEESGTQYTKSQTADEVYLGARMILAYDAPSNAFKGTVENTTNAVLPQVRVEVHLSNGTELGPTAPADLDPGQKMNITLPSTSQSFTTWSAHPEMGGQGGEGSGEGHGSEGGGG